MSQNVLSTQEALEMIAEVFEEPVASLSPDRAMDSIDAWDSMGILTFMAELDTRFGITINANEFSRLLVIGDLLELLKKNNILA
jgi:acyl carrier protein